MGERIWALGERVVVVFAMAAVAFIALAVTGTLPLPPPTPAGATEYCNEYQYNTCGPLVPPLIAFQSDRDGVGNFEIYKMNGDGSTQTRVFSNTNQSDVTPSWSPDATKIAFGSSRDGNSEIYVMTADGSAPTRLTNNVASDNAPSWSPDGTKIAFAANRDGNSEIYVMSPDGSAQARLTNNAAFEGLPAWSPDATKIAFTSNRDGSNQVYVMNANGSGQTRLSNNTASESMASWSPDGTKIAFSSNRDGNFEIYVMNANGTGQTRLTSNAATDISPAWSPDGTKIAFATTRNINSEIYVMNANGDAETRLTNNAAADSSPNWQRTAPGAPTGVSAVASGDGQATILFTAPASTGGSAISSYTVTAAPGGAHASGPASPITVTGLTNGTTYTFTVKATNGAGTGPASDPSNAVTPGPVTLAKIVIASDATNQVGQPHTFTVTLRKDTAAGLAPAPGEHVGVTLTDVNGASHTAATGSCTTPGANTDSNGQCTITFTSPTAGKVSGHASSTLSVGGVPVTVETDGVAPNSGDAVKTFVDANIQIAPLTSTNPVGTNHLLTAHVNVNSGSGAGFVNAPDGTSIFFTIDGGPGSFTTLNPCVTTGGTGSCQITLTSATTGTTVARAHVTLSVAGITVSRNTNGAGANSGPAMKTWAVATTLTYTGPTSAKKSGAKLKLDATLTAGVFPLSGATVTFTLDGNTYSATTNKKGVALVDVNAPGTAGSYPIGVTYAGSAIFAASSVTPSPTLTVP